MTNVKNKIHSLAVISLRNADAKRTFPSKETLENYRALLERRLHNHLDTRCFVSIKRGKIRVGIKGKFSRSELDHKALGVKRVWEWEVASRCLLQCARGEGRLRVIASGGGQKTCRNTWLRARFTGKSSARYPSRKAVVRFPEKKESARMTKKAKQDDAHYARLLDKATKVLGDAENAKRWLNSPQFGLGGAVPLDYAKTEIGTRQVETLLGRIEYGVYS